MYKEKPKQKKKRIYPPTQNTFPYSSLYGLCIYFFFVFPPMWHYYYVSDIFWSKTSKKKKQKFKMQCIRIRFIIKLLTCCTHTAETCFIFALLFFFFFCWCWLAWWSSFPSTDLEILIGCVCKKEVKKWLLAGWLAGGISLLLWAIEKMKVLKYYFANILWLP